MKKHFKLILAALSAFLLFVSNVPVVSAAENDEMQISDDTSSETENQHQYKNTVTIHVVDWSERFDGGTQTYTIISNSPVYLFKDESGTGVYLYLAMLDSSLEQGYWSSSSISTSKFCAVSSQFTYKNGVTEMKDCILGSGIISQGKTRMTVNATCPIFSSKEAMENYIKTGDDSGIENKEDLRPSFSKTLPYLRNVTWHINPNCYGSSPKVIGDEFTWDTSELYPAAKIEVKADIIVHFEKDNVLTDLTGGIAGVTKFTISDTVDIITYDDKTGISSPSYDSGYLLVPSDKFDEVAVYSVSNNPDFDYSAVKNVSITTYYLRMVFYDSTENKLHVGGWTRINVQSGLTSKDDFITTGDFDTETGKFVQDTDSEGSYSYGTNIDGSYDFDSSNGLPANIVEAFSQFVDIIGALIKSMGNVPALVKTVYSFLPSIFFSLLASSFIVVVILRILGR